MNALVSTGQVTDDTIDPVHEALAKKVAYTCLSAAKISEVTKATCGTVGRVVAMLHRTCGLHSRYTVSSEIIFNRNVLLRWFDWYQGEECLRRAEPNRVFITNKSFQSTAYRSTTCFGVDSLASFKKLEVSIASNG